MHDLHPLLRVRGHAAARLVLPVGCSTLCVSCDIP